MDTVNALFSTKETIHYRYAQMKFLSVHSIKQMVLAILKQRRSIGPGKGWTRNGWVRRE